MHIDPFSEFLQIADARSVVSGGFTAGGSWAIAYEDTEKIKFFAVTRGDCWLCIEGEQTPIRLEWGEVFLVSRRSFVLAGELEIAPVHARSLFTADTGMFAKLGDGDAFAIGGGHFIHAARRNLDVCYVIMDNAIYGLTKGQTSPTSMVGFITKTTPNGTPDRPVNPLQLAMASGATFVARAFSGKPKELADLIVQGIDHKGFAIIDTYSPCPTFNKVNTFKYYRDQATELPKDHNPTDVMQAWAKAQSTDPVYLGVLYRAEGEASFEDHIVAAQSGSDADAPQVIESILERYS